MIPKNWKITGIAALAVGSLTGVALADERIELIDRSDPIVLTPQDDDVTESPTPSVDASAESADSPTESPFDSVESATDSADDAGFVDDSAESAESADSPADSPEDPPSDDATP